MPKSLDRAVEAIAARVNAMTPPDRLRVAAELGIVRLKNRKGGDPSEWPEDLRVREFPKVGA